MIVLIFNFCISTKDLPHYRQHYSEVTTINLISLTSPCYINSHHLRINPSTKELQSPAL